MNGDGATVWVNGTLVPADQAAIPATDRGLTTGTAVFETMKLVRGQPFALRRHLARLRRSCATLGLEPVPSDQDLAAAVAAASSAGGHPDGRVRVTVTAGTPTGAPAVIVEAGPRPDHPATASCALVPWTRNERGALAGLKTTSYAENVVALAWARARGADEALFANTAGHLCEGTATNVVACINGVLITPPLSAGCLPGVTREILMEELSIVEVDLPIEELDRIEEAFLTSSTRDIQPVTSLDGRELPCPGPLTVEAQMTWKQIEARTLDP